MSREIGRPASGKGRARGAAESSASGPLTRDRVVAVALAAIDRDGPASFSMRKLGAELGVTPMALYNHVGGKDALLKAVVETVLADIRFDAGAKDWRQRVGGCFWALRNACLLHPGVARLIEIDGVAPAGVFAPMELTVAALTGSGLPATEALRAYFTLVAFTLGQASYQVRGANTALEPATAAAAGHLSPSVSGLLDQISAEGWDFDAAFEAGLALILDGIDAALARYGDA